MGLFSAKCPVDDDTRVWIEDSYRWFVAEFGLDIVTSVDVILPTPEFFPDAFDGSRQSIRKMVEKVCDFMDVDPGLLAIRFYEQENETPLHPLAADEGMRSHALGTYQRRRDGMYQISLDIGNASNPEMLVATIAHELGHVILLGEDRLDPDYEHHEPLTDLLTVFYGLGVFNANSAVVFEQWANSQYLGWRISGAGYLSEEAFGYGFAVFAGLRGEAKPRWADHLNTNVRSYFKKGVRYLDSNPAILDAIRQSDIVDPTS